MRILNYINHHNGGITYYTKELLRVMPAQVDAHVICPPGAPFDAAEPTVHPCLVEIGNTGVFWGRVKFLWSQYKNPSQLLRLIKSLRPDMVHFGNVNHLTYVYWGRYLKSLGIPFVVTVHDVRREKALVSRWWEDRQLLAVYRDAAGLFVHSMAQQLEVAEFAGVSLSKITIVPLGAYEYPRAESPFDVRKELGIPTCVQVGLFFGSVRDDKGLGDLISAVARQADRHLIVAGSCASNLEKPVTHYREQAIKLGAEKRIHFIDSFIPEDRVADYFHAADWCGLAYRPEFTSQSAVLCSAVHFKTPVLVSTSPTLVETVKRYKVGVVAADSSVMALSNAIHELLDATKAEQPFGFDKFEKECTWSRNAEITYLTYLNIYNKCSKDIEIA